MIEYYPGRANSVANALSRKSQGRLNIFYSCSAPLLTDLRSTGVTLGTDREGALLANFQVRPILLDRVLEAQANDPESQALVQAVLKGKIGDLRIWRPDSMLIQGDRMYVPDIEELKK